MLRTEKKQLNCKAKLAARGVINMTYVNTLSTPICFQSRALESRRVSQLYEIFMNE